MPKVHHNIPSKKKLFFPVNDDLREYLVKYGREITLPLQYSDMLRFNLEVPLLDKNGKDTLWKTVYYDESNMRELYPALTYIYSLLTTHGDTDLMTNLSVSRIDFCAFGNSKPFRVRIINRLNDNYDHFYVKVADASRVYGLELEHILSPNRITYLTEGNTLIEEHIIGLPGDVFIDSYLDDVKFNQIRVSKEFVKFNERCFVRLLGDMRSYNFVVDITPDIEGLQYRLRAIDFDQQSYEGRKNFYLPHYFKENNKLVFLGMQHMNHKTMSQYQEEERTLMATRYKSSSRRVGELFSVLGNDTISTTEKVSTLRAELAEHHHDAEFLKYETMGQVVIAHIHACLGKRLEV
ncbi:hypothetical protein [Solitalea koreensis]|uniref:Uncharacterized protein n=1 Tax=Solitalea koreensis TaxID=543615 RepID=A0A521AS40_9SPHI|nr:hypothetical protein [Solitalea koreensis]SMO37653.1 hypothetical protein SAMN06265350_101362 [Solitalea koreensis]